MKKITLLFALFIFSIGYSQQVVVEDFEGSPDVAGFEGLGSATIKDDPATGGTNGKTLELVTATGGNAWQGAEAVFTDGTLLDITTDKTIKVDVYSTTAFSLFAKVEGTGSPAAGNTQPHSGSGWETLTFSFTTGSDGTATANGDYSKIAFFPNRNSTDSGWNSPVSSLTINIDNISGVKKTVAPPSTATYDLLESFDGTGLEDAFGGAAAAYDADPAGGSDQVIKITNSGNEVWQGINVVLTSNYTLTSATQLTMQLDVYSTTAITIAPKAQGGLSGAPNAVTSVSHSGGSGWETLTFTFDQTLDGQGPANGIYSDFALHINWNATTNTFGTPDGRIFYIKNLKGLAVATTPDPVPPTAAPSPTNSDPNIIKIYSDTGAFTANSITWPQAYDFGTNAGNIDLDPTAGVNNALKMNFAAAGYGAGSASPVDITNYTHVHFDYYAPTLDAGANGHQVRFILIGEGQGEKNYELTPAGSDGTLVFDAWQQVDVPLSFFEGKGLTKDKFLQYKLGTESDLNTKIVYFDNIYFYNSATAGVEDNIFNVSIYPNPASNRLNISAANTIQNAEIYNVLGKKVMNVTINKTSESIDISNLASGVYIIKYNIENTFGTAKFIKQ